MEFCTAGELQRVRMNRTVLQMRRKMKMTGMRISFLSAMEVRGWRAGAPERMGRYSESAACFGERGETRTEQSLQTRDPSPRGSSQSKLDPCILQEGNRGTAVSSSHTLPSKTQTFLLRPRSDSPGGS